MMKKLVFVLIALLCFLLIGCKEKQVNPDGITIQEYKAYDGSSMGYPKEIRIFYFFVGIGGYFLWRKGNRADAISVYGWKVRIVWGLVTMVLIVLSWTALSKTNNPLPLLDSITSITSIIATWFMFCHKLETWVVWLVNDVFYIAEYFMLPDKALYLIGLYAVWTILAIVSFVNWRRLYFTHIYIIRCR